MSYCYDVMASVFRKHIEPLLKEQDRGELADHFLWLIEEMHSANHAVPSADGAFKGDGINKAPGVTQAARELEEVAKALKG